MKQAKMLHSPGIKNDGNISYFCIGSVVNTNMFLESFHRTLKVICLQHKHNRQIDYIPATHTFKNRT